MDEAALRQQYTTLLRSTRRNVISPLLKGAAAAFGLSLGYALWDACSVLAARGLVVAGASLGRLRLLKA